MGSEAGINSTGRYDIHDKTSLVDDIKEELKLKEFLKKVDTKFYHRVIENRQQYVGRYFPHRGENGAMFSNIYRYVSIGQEKESCLTSKIKNPVTRIS